jgi:fumarylacetoacetase
MRQMMAHHSTTGCPLNPGDLFGTGTLSAPGEDGYGSLIEKSKMGREEFIISSKAKKRTFLEDGDSVLMTGLARSENGYCIGFGGCEGTILPAIPIQSQ